MKKILVLAVLFILAFPTAASAKINYASQKVILLIQQALNERGYDCGTPDGELNEQTKEAVRQFKEDKELQLENRFDAILSLILEIEDAVSLTEAYSFVRCTDDEYEDLLSSDWESLSESIRNAAAGIGVTGGEILEIGNYEKDFWHLRADILYSTGEGKNLILRCVYTTGWEIGKIFDAETGNYYYVNDFLDSEYDIYSYETGLLISDDTDDENRDAAALSRKVRTDHNLDFIGGLVDDSTGTLRLAIYASSDEFPSFAADYYHSFFESDDEVHIIINHKTKTTYKAVCSDNMLKISSFRHIEKEELSAGTLFSGDLLNRYLVDCSTGEVSALQ